MLIYRRSFAGEIDRVQMRNLVFSFPEQNHHVVDLTYRLCSPAAQLPENGAVWENGRGTLAGIAILQDQFATLDCVVHPMFPEVHEQIVAWGTDEIQRRAIDRHRSFYYMADALEGDEQRASLLREHGWHQDDWSLFHMAVSLDKSLPAYTLPDGFTIRTLAGEAEAQAYERLHRAAFKSENMTEAWRRRILRHPDYMPDIDLVAVAPDGTLAAICIGWLARVKVELVSQIEPIGVLPAYHRMGLGRAILYENLRRTQAAGATTAFIEAESNNEASTTLYKSAGFQVAATWNKYLRSFDTQ